MESRFVFVFMALACFGAGQAYNETEYINSLITRGEALIAQVSNDMQKFQNEKNYFLKPIQDQLALLESILNELKRDKDLPPDPVTDAFLNQAELQVTQHENNMKRLVHMAEVNGADPTYKMIVQMIDDLKTRSFQDIGNLMTHNANLDMSQLMNEIRKVEDMEKVLKSLDFRITPEQAQNAVQQLLVHEQVIEAELFRLEQEIHKNNGPNN